MTSRAWYGVALAILFAGLGSAGWIAWHGFAGIAHSLVRVVVPGEAVLDLDEAGTYTIFHESPGIVDGREYASDDIAGLEVAIRDAASGAPVAVHQPSGSAKYQYGGRKGVSFRAFAIAAPGRYVLSAFYRGGRAGDRAVLTIEHGLLLRLATTLTEALGFGLIGLILGTVVGAITFAKRQRQRRVLAAS